MGQLTLEELKQLFLKGETKQIEFKSRITDIGIIAKIIVAFANTDGGKLIVGYNERSKSIVGCSEKDEKLLHQAIALLNNQKIFINTYKIPCDDKEILIVEVEKHNSPIIFKGVIYSREQGGIISMRGEQVKDMFSHTSNEQLLEAITILSKQNEQLNQKIDKNSRSSTKLAWITCVVSAVLGFILSKFIDYLF